jgi:polyisoprenoid-binding protein YceI
VWRKIHGATGTIVLDRAAGTGTVNVSVETATVQTGGDLDKHLKSNEFLDVEKFSTATYKGKITSSRTARRSKCRAISRCMGSRNRSTLTVRSFKCMPHPMKKGQDVRRDAHGSINREDFGMTWGKNFGFDMKVGSNCRSRRSRAEVTRIRRIVRMRILMCAGVLLVAAWRARRMTRPARRCSTGRR